jgi:hypothetical protein
MAGATEASHTNIAYAMSEHVQGANSTMHLVQGVPQYHSGDVREDQSTTCSIRLLRRLPVSPSRPDARHERLANQEFLGH